VLPAGLGGPCIAPLGLIDTGVVVPPGKAVGAPANVPLSREAGVVVAVVFPPRAETLAALEALCAAIDGKASLVDLLIFPPRAETLAALEALCSAIDGKDGLVDLLIFPPRAETLAALEAL
jgi:hypothetical protein